MEAQEKGQQPPKGGYSVCATKHAILGTVTTAAREYAEKNIRFDLVAPGPVKTRMLLDLLDQGLPVDHITDPVPMKRMGEPEEIGHRDGDMTA
ncbi:hypothetical protein JCM8115_001586 [Rhodotorula mucilaginosa]